jgi:hypothetical protein
MSQGLPGRGLQSQLEAGRGVEDEVHQPDSSRASATIAAPLTLNSSGVSVRREASNSVVSRARSRSDERLKSSSISTTIGSSARQLG